MSANRRISPATAAVLELFLREPGSEFYGLEIINRTGIKSGSLYPILHRLEARELLLGSWEDLDMAAERGSRPRRRYRLNLNQIEHARGLHAAWLSSVSGGALKPRIGFAT